MAVSPSMASRRRSCAATTFSINWRRAERGFKLLLTQTDKQNLLALMKQEPQPAEPSLRITENFAFFEQQVQALGADLTPLCRGLAKLLIVDIALSRRARQPSAYLREHELDRVQPLETDSSASHYL